MRSNDAKPPLMRSLQMIIGCLRWSKNGSRVDCYVACPLIRMIVNQLLDAYVEKQ